MEEKTQYRISMAMSVVLMFFATIGDGLSLIPFVGTFIGPIFWICVTIYLWIKGTRIIVGSKLATTAISFVAEVIPVVQELPMLLAGIIALLFIIRMEDRTGMSILKPMSKGVTPPRLKRNPLNGQEGVRLPRKTTREIPLENEDQEMIA